MAITHKKVNLSSREVEVFKVRGREVTNRGMYFEAVVIGGDLYLKYYSKLQKFTNIDSLDWYSIVAPNRNGYPARYIRYTDELKSQLIQTVKYRNDIHKEEA